MNVERENRIGLEMRLLEARNRELEERTRDLEERLHECESALLKAVREAKEAAT